MYIKTFQHPSPIGDITLVRLENAGGSWVELSTLGAGITGLAVPDRKGRIRNVALSYDNVADYIGDGPCMGKTAGRYANRIARGHLEIDGNRYSLPVNCGPNHLHGGPEGFQNRNWNLRMLEDNGVEFSLRSVDGEMGYPGNLDVKVTYHWDDDCRLRIELEATTDKPTVVNLTNHTYWNLRGDDAGTALDHNLRISASRYLDTDKDLTPTGKLVAVEGTPMDFRQTKIVGLDIKADFPALNFGKGYDACWAGDANRPAGEKEAVDRDCDGLAEVVVLSDGVTGRVLTVSSDQPGVQVYTGNWLNGSAPNRVGHSYNDYEGIAIEAQGFPDAPNHPDFPSQLLRPSETYRRHITYSFTIMK